MTQTKLIGRFLLGTLYTSIAVAILATAILVVSKGKSPKEKIMLGGERIMVTIADTPELQSKGLSGHKKLEPNEGMLFIFSDSGTHGFWMKEMLFPIDIIWFDSNRQVIDVWENATADSYPKVYTPKDEAQYVLEVEAGFFGKHLLKRGDVLELESLARYNNSESGRVK